MSLVFNGLRLVAVVRRENGDTTGEGQIQLLLPRRADERAMHPFSLGGCSIIAGCSAAAKAGLYLDEI